MNEQYEPALVKARKLAALADPANGGAPGEVENARRALEKLCSAHGITPDRLEARNRKRLTLWCVSSRADWKPKIDADLVQLAGQVLRFVLGENVGRIRDIEVVQGLFRHEAKGRSKAKRPAKEVPVCGAEASVTDLEFEEWKECFDHYVPAFLDTQANLRSNLNVARRALKMARRGFINKHKIFPPDVEEGDPLPLDKLRALAAAMSGVAGEEWTRKAGKLAQGDFMLQ